MSSELLGGTFYRREWLVATLCLGGLNALVAALSSLLFGLGGLLISGPVLVSTSYLLLNKVRTRNEFELRHLLKGVEDDLLANVGLGVQISVYTFLWSLLFVIPGLVKSYAYSMAGYIKNDNPDLTPGACIAESQDLMRGNKMKLFLLDLSFIGWYLLGSLCFGIGTLFVLPYHQMARTVFYETLVGDPSNIYVSNDNYNV
jgi:uncharacterized membrane protein